MERIRIKVEGRVQGVFFRAHTQEKASSLGLTGWVRNSEDGGVEAVAEGNKKELEALINWCHKGPPAAKVMKVDVEWLAATGEFKGFHVSY